MVPVTVTPATTQREAIAETMRRYWGYDQFRPLQLEAIETALAQQDSLVVLPTGGGKSLCYAVPPVVANRTDIVVSPLIALMKDQVDALQACGYPAAAIHSGLTDADRHVIDDGLRANAYRLLFVAPERLLTPWFLAHVKRLNVQAFAIDEAHCISHWGHDFRPEYRRLAELKTAFPKAAVHAYTATATDRVRQDIIDQLGLQQPRVLVGRFDRPNLVYRIVPKRDVEEQALQVVRRHPREAVIIYCISRADTERLATALRTRGVKAAPYHAGLDGATRSKTQEAFAAERLDVVVATVAFGMGIDRSNVRCVIHAALPKSVEQYQQETGRAGRDGLEAECVLLYSPEDARRWESLLTRPAPETTISPENLEAQLGLLADMQQFASSHQCRHAALSGYFGQPYEGDGCRACDICLDETNRPVDGTEIAQQVLACVKAMGSSFGLSYLVDVLRGARSGQIEARGHRALPQYGALRRMTKETLQPIVHQLIQQGLLTRTAGDRPVVMLTPAAGAVLSGKRTVALAIPRAAPVEPERARNSGLTGPEADLFERLRELRRTVAQERSVPAFVIFGDSTLRELARLRPGSLSAFAMVRGVGERKLADLGARFVAEIAAFSRERALAAGAPARPPAPGGAKQHAYALFEKGESLQAVAAATGRALSTVGQYLDDYIGERNPDSLAPWITDDIYQRVHAAAAEVGGTFLRPVFEALGGEVSYEEIRVVMSHAGMR